ncbi:LOW QUALITY PROTEIN: uncharacterized protein LOC126853234 [Cataglyphis hispanica]|uniref:LOW QUALITY PROTEIN: uncharacterized protein LOC126853234 n=1 Tax=Cataglyphis hispanica TaxID=1086592 RepID=UPI00217F3581|nr:LOW QUALITY PROTEIN: uncharacterized protein LOC126853234 [Cataglyphis hispanica]
MAPTICVAEFPMVGTTVNTYVHRRRRSQNGISTAKRQTFSLEQMILHIGTIIETSLTSGEKCSQKLEYTNMIPNCSIPDKSTKHSTNTNECCRKLVTSKKDLLNIIIRTIILVQRNRILQRRLNVLRAETRRFLRSVLNNPENQCQEQRLQMSTRFEDEIVSSTTEKVSTLSPSLHFNSSKNLFHETVSACNNLDHTNDKSNDQFD